MCNSASLLNSYGCKASRAKSLAQICRKTGEQARPIFNAAEARDATALGLD